MGGLSFFILDSPGLLQSSSMFFVTDMGVCDLPIYSAPFIGTVPSRWGLSSLLKRQSKHFIGWIVQTNKYWDHLFSTAFYMSFSLAHWLQSQEKFPTHCLLSDGELRRWAATVSCGSDSTTVHWAVSFGQVKISVFLDSTLLPMLTEEIWGQWNCLTWQKNVF